MIVSLEEGMLRLIMEQLFELKSALELEGMCFRDIKRFIALEA